MTYQFAIKVLCFFDFLKLYFALLYLLKFEKLDILARMLRRFIPKGRAS